MKKIVLALTALSVLLTSCGQSELKKEDVSIIEGHPRIMLLPGGEEQIREKIASDAFLADVDSAIKSHAFKFAKSDYVYTHELEGKRMLSVSRAALNLHYS